jgi:hypothetical protein
MESMTLEAYKKLPKEERQLLETQVSHAMLSRPKDTEEERSMIDIYTEQINESLPSSMKLSKVEVATLLIQIGWWLIEHGTDHAI